ncbi:VCBS domain-containing protein, partial [Mesorhizobium sp. M4B.F.Ca.ET.200.01.1.1]|uniref:VCBS domain-containing protein n=1 Tax=Mesorhizobium sp. M4B.F.Ca.ET.200.01.1.1 TaxID=2563952 RepID=UPI001AEE9493
LHLNSDGSYSYTLDNGLASVQQLAEGATVTDVFSYTNADNHGGSSSASLTITITGTNDAPVAVADAAAVKEDTNTLADPNPVSGNVLSNDTDVDNGDTHSVSAVNGSAGNVGNDLVGTYGTLHLNSDGSYSYTLDNGLASVQQLAEGATVTDVFSYTNA